MPVYKKIDKNFFKYWSSEMAYILGFLFADGNIIKTKRGSHFVSIYSGDRKLLQQIKKVMQLGHKIARRSKRSGSVYRIQIGSREMYGDLLNLGFVPNKTNRMRVPKVPRAFVGEFIRGFFDGDGNVWSGFVNKKRKVPVRVISVAFTSASILFLEDLLGLLKGSNFGIEGGSLRLIKNKNCARLSFGTKDSLKLYGIMYNASVELFLERKKVVFEKFIKMRL